MTSRLSGPGVHQERRRGGPSALVLGGNGFIGERLVQHLRRLPNWSAVQVAGHAGSEPRTHGVDAVEGDINPDLLERCATPDVVLWLAGGASVGGSRSNPEADFQRSVPPLRDLLERLGRQWETTHLVFVSSAAVYGSAASGATSTSTRLEPVSPYGEHKRISEEIIQEAVARRGVSATIVRPFSVYGTGLRRQLFWDAMNKIRRADLSFSGTGREERDWVNVNDLVDLLADIAASPARFPRTLNAGTGVAVSNEQVLTALFSTLARPAVPRFSKPPRPGDPEQLVACRTEQEPLLHYFRTELRDGLVGYSQWFLASTPS